MNTSYQKCTKCEEKKHIDEFGLKKRRLKSGIAKKYRQKVCKSCHNKYQKEYFDKNKDQRIKQNKRVNNHQNKKVALVAEWKQESGCVVCGYNRCAKSLHYHHLDPSEKNFDVSHGAKSRKIEDVKKEIKKCVILCANCHSELEDNHFCICPIY